MRGNNFANSFSDKPIGAGMLPNSIEGEIRSGQVGAENIYDYLTFVIPFEVMPVIGQRGHRVSARAPDGSARI
ncbi:Uncharacterised protein [Mycobacteroides abscessus subsp. bolletii]|nr:Uncharacterised protein [Mycobacteroides abscessus subsp. bolletii]SKX18459.1 Uncharacterised protein [Mycobacteroides abscessus subsp. bolletii]